MGTGAVGGAVTQEARRFRLYLAAKDEIHDCYLRGNFFLCHFCREVNARLQLPPDDIFFAGHKTLRKFLEGSLDLAALKKEVRGLCI